MAARAKEIQDIYSKAEKVGWSETAKVLNEHAEKIDKAKSPGEEKTINQEAPRLLIAVRPRLFRRVALSSKHAPSGGRSGIAPQPG